MSPKNSNGNLSASISNHNSNINRIRRDNQQQQQHKNRQQMQNQVENSSNHIEVLNSHNQTGLASSSTAGRSPGGAAAGDGNIADEATTSTDNNVEENAEEEPAISTTTAGGGGSSRNIRPEDVLWWICLFFTARCFDLPAVLIFSKKINRFFLQLAFLCPFLLILLTFFHALARPIFGNWARRWLWAIQLAAGLLFLGTPLCFCLATWEQFGVWSLFISIVGIQSALALIAVL